MKATAFNVRETETGIEGGIDIDVEVTVGGETRSGEVTLVRGEGSHEGQWTSFGSADHWVAGDLLNRTRHDRPRFGAEAVLDTRNAPTLRAVLDTIEAEASRAASDEGR